MGRRRAIASSPTSENILDAAVASRIGWYTFEGRSNSDADRNIVADKSGNGLDMQVYFENWGASDGYTTTGYSEGCVGSFPTTAVVVNYILIPLLKPLDDNFTIIIERARYSNAGLNKYCALVGSCALENANASPILIEYKEEQSASYARDTKYRGKILMTTASESPIIWVTPDSYMGQEATGQVSNTYTIKEIYIGRVRKEAGESQRFKIKSVHLFSQKLTDKQIQAYINAYIDEEFAL